MVTPEELCEIEEIKNLRYLYAHYYDGNRTDELVDLFTEDAVCDFGESYGKWVGKEEIHREYSAAAAGGRTDYGILHNVMNPWIRLVDETTARGRWYLINIRSTVGEENPLMLAGIYDETYKKTGDGWKIHRTRIDFLWPRREYAGSTDL